MTMIPSGLKGLWQLPGLTCVCYGETRRLYELPGFPNELLVLCTDQTATQGFVLNGQLTGKGHLMNALNVWWHVIGLSFMNDDLIAHGRAIDEYLPPELRRNPDLQRRATVVRRLSEILPIRIVVSGYGRGGRKLAQPHIGYMTKDPNGLFSTGRNGQPDLGRHGKLIPGAAADIYKCAAHQAERQGLVLAEIQLQVGRHSHTGDVVWTGEWFTMNTANYWTQEQWDLREPKEEGGGPYCDRLLSQWTEGIGLEERDPTDDADVAYVHGHQLPATVATATMEEYSQLFTQLTTYRLSDFQRTVMKTV